MDIRGVARTNGWQLDVGLLRSWIRRLRGICTHPLVGQLTARQVDDLRKPGALKTIGEVLEASCVIMYNVKLS
jgi:E3 ubiquitin-protein ligase SHPRH